MPSEIEISTLSQYGHWTMLLNFASELWGVECIQGVVCGRVDARMEVAESKVEVKVSQM